MQTYRLTGLPMLAACLLLLTTARAQQILTAGQGMSQRMVQALPRVRFLQSKRLPTIRFFLLALLPFSSAFAQTALPSTRLFNARDGLPDNKVAQLLETQKSPFRWAITTNELCRFDGYRFQTVWEKLPEISGFAENSRGEIVIWHYPGEQALSVFEPDSGSKTTRKTAEIPNLKGRLVNAWAQDTLIFLCLETAPDEVFEVWRLFPDFSTQLLYRLRTDPAMFRRLPSPRPKPVGHFDQKTERLWLSANLLGKANQILRIDLKTAHCDTLRLFDQALPSTANVQLSYTPQMPLRVCLGTGAFGTVYTWNETRQTFEKDLRYPGAQTGLTPIGEDKKGAIIFLKSDQGVVNFWLRRPDGSWLDLQPMLPKLNFKTCTGSDFSRQINFATFEGVLRVNFEKPLFRQFVPEKTAQLEFLNPAFRGITADHVGNLWLASEMIGLFRMRPDGSVEHVPLFEKNTRNEVKADNAVNLQTDAAGNIWSARNSPVAPCLLRFDPKTALADTFILERHAVPTFLMLKNGYILLAANDGKTAKIALLDPATRRFQTLAKTGESERFKTAPLFFLENEAGQVWIAGNEGLALFDPEARRFLDFPGDDVTAHEFPMAVLFLEKENLWCGTLGGGLRRLNLKTGTWQVFTMQDGLPANKIAGMLPDGNGNLWISTWDGLSFFQPQASLFTNFYTANGLTHNEFNRFSFFKNSDGKLFFGGLKGVSFFKPAELLASFSQGYDTLLISQISWFAPDGRTRQEQIFGFDRLQKITLPPDNRFCSIRLALANYLLPEANRFSWKLEGYDHDWHLNGTSNEITFHYLPAGTYRLRVRAANPTGVWGKNERVLQIEVREFWYKTAWFFGLLAAATGSLFYFFYRARVRRKLDLAESRRIRELDNLRARLYTNLTHEFRTPLTVILGMAQQSRKDIEILGYSDIGKVTPHPISQHLNILISNLTMIERNGKSLLQLINQLLDLSKLENNALRLQLVQQDIVPYLRYMTEAFQTYANSKNLSLRFFAPFETLVIDFDPEQIKQVLTNLISNAVKFTPLGGEVTVRLSRGGQNLPSLGDLEGLSEGEPLQIAVSDTGIGIAEKDLPHIFDRFYQADSSTTREREGTGIGLAHTQELVKLMGGSVSVESEVGKGTTFIVRLPVKQEAALAPSPPDPLKGEPRMENPAAIFNANPASGLSEYGSPFRGSGGDGVGDVASAELPVVLLIEDNPDVVNYLLTCLAGAYQTQVARNGKIGVELALEHIPDLIITDVMMPEKDGYQVCDLLKNDERTSHIPILILTAKADAASRMTGLRRGADAYLAKPFDVEEMLVQLERLLANQQRIAAHFSKIMQGGEAARPQISAGEMQESRLAGQALQEVVQVEDAFLQKVKSIIEANYSKEDFALPQLCRSLGMSRSQLFRKMKAVADTSPADLIRSHRLYKAKSLLENSLLTVSEIAWQTGFKDLAHFSRSYLEMFGVTPSGTRK